MEIVSSSKVMDTLFLIPLTLFVGGLLPTLKRFYTMEPLSEMMAPWIETVNASLQSANILMNQTVELSWLVFNTVQEKGTVLLVSFMQSLATLGEVGKAVQTILVAFATVLVYCARFINTLAGSFEAVQTVSKRLLFAHESLTWDEMTSLIFPVFVVGAVLGFLSWRLSARREAPKEKPLRRSSRLARKRALLLSDSSSLLPSASNL